VTEDKKAETLILLNTLLTACYIDIYSEARNAKIGRLIEGERERERERERARARERQTDRSVLLKILSIAKTILRLRYMKEI
jgi:hypothetical protein